jgi:transposase
MMSGMDWVVECDALQIGGLRYKDLAKHFGVTIGTISGALHRYRNNKYKSGQYHKISNNRVRGIIAERKAEADAILAGIEVENWRHRCVIEAWGNGGTSRECGTAGGYSYTWANRILRYYGLKTNKRFPARIRNRVRAADAVLIIKTEGQDGDGSGGNGQ